MVEEKRKILIVEDYAVLARMYQNKLRADGFEVEVALDGEEGEKKIRELKPDLVLLDIMLPKKDGLEILEAIKKDPETAEIAVILLTNLGGPPETIERGLQLGAVAYLVKANYTPRQVIDLVKETLTKKVIKPVPPEEPVPSKVGGPPPEEVEPRPPALPPEAEAGGEKPARERRALREAAEEEVRKATTLLEMAQKQAQEAMKKLKELEEEMEKK